MNFIAQYLLFFTQKNLIKTKKKADNIKLTAF